MTPKARGAVYIEFLIAIVPLLLLFFGILQINGLFFADLVVRDAAMHAVRAAVVCDSDKATSGIAGATDCAKQAATDTLAAVRSVSTFQVTIDGASPEGNDPVTATVAAVYRCLVPLVGALACAGRADDGAPAVVVSRSATLPNQGHYYKF